MKTKGQHRNMRLFCVFLLAFLSTAHVTAVDENPLPRTALMCKGLVEEYWTKWFEDRCYTYHPEQRSWHSGESHCIAIGGHLSKVESTSLGRTLLTGQVYKARIYRNVPELTTSRKWWMGGKQAEDKIFRWTDDTPVLNEDWTKAVDIKTTFIGWFKSISLCITLANGVHVNGDTLTITDEHISGIKQDCSELYPYVCEHDLPKITLEEPVASKVMTTATNTSTTSVPTTTRNDLPKITVKEPATSKMMTTTINTTTTAVPTTTTNVVPMGVKPVRRTVRYTFQNVKISKNPKLRADPDDVYLETNEIKCTRLCASDDRCEIINYFRPNTCTVYYDAERALEKGVISVKGSTIWQIYRQRKDQAIQVVAKEVGSVNACSVNPCINHNLTELCVFMKDGSA